MASQDSSDGATAPVVTRDSTLEASPSDPPDGMARAGAGDIPAAAKHMEQAGSRRHGRRGAVQPRFDELSMDEPTVRRLVLTLAGPSIVDNLLVTLVGMADMIMVGRLGADAIAAVGLSNQPMFFALASFMALNVGSTALVARLVGGT